MQILIIGLGSIGHRHSKNLKSLGYTDFVGVDPNEKARRRFEDSIGAQTYDSLKNLTPNIKPKLSIICSPNIFHVTDAIFCAKLGSNLMIEKPLAVNLENIQTLESIVRKKKLFVHIGSNFKFHKGFRLVKSLIDKDKVGRILSAQVLAGQWLPDWHPQEDYRKGYSARKDLGGGIISDTHEFDYITWLLGPVENIVGLRSNSGVLDINTEDVAAASIEFKNGAICTVQVDYIQRDYKRRYTISGDEGTIEWNFADDSLSLYEASTKKKSIIEYTPEPINEMYLRQMKHVIEGIKNRNEPETPLHHGIETLKLQLRLKGKDV
tara:strand:+ start:5909 stop:6874 length:966 start_codon:yes stop_codon:yes gene_type:complete